MTAEAKIRISTEGAQALKYLKEMRAEFDQIGKDGAKAGEAIEAKWAQSIAQIEKGLNQVGGLQRDLATIGAGGGLSNATQQAGRLTEGLREARNMAAQLVATLAGAEAARRGAELSDTYVGMTARLKIATRSQAELNDALGKAKALTDQYGGALDANANSLTRTLSALRPLNGGLKEAVTVNEALLASLKVSGATAEEAASSVLQFSQALGKGALNGDEFNSISEAAPRLLQALADGIGVPTAALKEMGAQGQLTTSKIVEGLTRSLPQLRKEAASIPSTIGQAVQQVNNELLLYVGKASQASGASLSVVAGLQAIGRNIEPIVTVLGSLAVLVGVTYVGRLAAGAIASAQFAVQQTVIAAAARSAAAEMGMAAAASTSLTAAIGGPVGLVVALASLAAGWIALEGAKNRAAAANQTSDDLRKQRAAVQAELDQLNERRRKGQVNTLDAKDQATELTRTLATIDAKLTELEQRAADQLRMSGGARGASTTDQLLDPATIQAIEKQYKTKEVLEKEFADKRAAYTLAKDAEINLARTNGSLAWAEKLETQKAAVLKKMDKDLADQIRDLDKDEQITRLAQAKDTYDKQAMLQADALQRSAAAAKQAYDDGLLSYRAYLQQRGRAEDQALAAEVSALDRQLGAQRAALAQNQAMRQKANTANDRAAADDAVAKGLETIQRLEVDIEKKKRDQVDAARARAREERQILEDLRQQREQIDRMLAQATNSQTPESVGRDVRRQYEPQLQKVLQNDQDPGPLLKLIDVEVERAKFQLLLRQFQDQKDQLSAAEASVNADKQAGLITEQQAEQQILELRRQSAQSLRTGADALTEQSKRLDEVAGKSQSKESVQAKGANTDVKVLADSRTEMEKFAKSSASASISTELTNIMTGTKKAGQGLKDMVKNFASSMLDLINKKLADQLISSLFGGPGGAPGGAGGGGGWASVIASFFHSGGVVAAGGGSRALPAQTWALAPRYHTGGIAGLAPNEVPAILQAGEEVLTANDPRHSQNASRRVGNVTVNSQVSITASSGTASEAESAAADLTTTINGAIDAWAARQSRPGGVLAKG